MSFFGKIVDALIARYDAVAHRYVENAENRRNEIHGELNEMRRETDALYRLVCDMRDPEADVH